MSEGTRIGFVGGGNMAQALARGLLGAGHPAARLCMADPDGARRAQCATLADGVRVTADNLEVAATADVLVLAVKPQVLGEVVRALAHERGPDDRVVLSVAAGVTLETLHRHLGAGTAIIRAMPNQPALVGAGITALVPGRGVSDRQRTRAGYVMETVGQTVWLDEEALLDAVTAISGSGPAYFYLLMELMEEVAAELGLPGSLAARLVRQTALGAAKTALEDGREPAALRASVTSPGGTTAAALEVLADADIRSIVRRALVAARDRSAALGRADPPH